MRIPDPQPDRPGTPTTPGASPRPATRAQFARLKAILAEDAQPDQGDLVVRLDGEPPSEDALASMDAATRALVSWVVDHREEVARRVADDRDFAELLATDPRAALAGLGMDLPDLPDLPGTTRPTRPGATRPTRPGATRPTRPAPAADVFASLGGRRFEIPRELLELDLTDQGPSIAQGAAVGLLAETLRGALATANGWTALRADPPAAVLAASRRFGWTAHGMAPDSPAAASVVQQVGGALAGALQWSGPTSSGSTGPSTATTPGTPVTRSDLVDLEIRTGRLRTVRIPTGRKEG